jgi:hypothetical protein
MARAIGFAAESNQTRGKKPNMPKHSISEISFSSARYLVHLEHKLGSLNISRYVIFLMEAHLYYTRSSYVAVNISFGYGDLK